MTVSGETCTGSTDQPAAEQFTEIYAEHWNRLRKYVHFTVPLHMTDLAEDFAQETFIELWRHMLKGRPVTRPYGLLRFMAVRKIASHFAVKSNLDYKAVDMEDPATVAILNISDHRYAANDPVLASLAAELDQAMLRMQDASASWRELHKKTHLLDQRIASGFDTERVKQNAATARQDRDSALVGLQEACGAVGAIRAELERVGGGDWKSSSGLPASVAGDGKGRAGSVASDNSRTHCDAGHRLDLDNSSFSAGARRSCRRCAEATVARSTGRTRKGTDSSYRTAVTQVVLDRALAVLMDPANSHRTLNELAPEIGLSSQTLRRHFPNLGLRRRAAAVDAGTPHLYRARVPDAVIEEARRALADPGTADLAISDIAAQVGAPTASLYKRLPVAELRKASQAGAAATKAAR